jgi:hypothetical protein
VRPEGQLNTNSLEANQAKNQNTININNSPIQLIDRLKGYYYINPLLSVDLAPLAGLIFFFQIKIVNYNVYRLLNKFTVFYIQSINLKIIMVFIKSVNDKLSSYTLQRSLLFFFLMLLLSLLLIPIIGVFVILVNKDNGVSLTNIKFIALTASVVNLFLSLTIFILFDFSTNQFQFVQEYHEISYFDFFLGIDGLSIYFILLTTIIIPISILSN